MGHSTDSGIFFSDDGLLASKHENRIKRVFEVLTDLFDQVGLRINVGKTVSMAYQPFCMLGATLRRPADSG